MKKLNLIGDKYNRLLVIGDAPPINGRRAWLCECDCGTIKPIQMDELRNGGTKSCGCLNNEKRSARAKAMYAVITKYAPDITTARKIWKNYMKRDKKEFGIINDMTFEEFYALSQMNCHYCGDLPSNKANAPISDKKASEYAKTNGFFIYNGLDRVDNTRHHSADNVVPCCANCNWAKGDRVYDEFIAWIKRAYSHIVKRETMSLEVTKDETSKSSQ